MDELGHAGDLGSLVADALQVGNGLYHHHQHAQVRGGGLALGDNLRDLFINLHFQGIDRVVLGHDLVSQEQIAVDQRVHRLGNLSFHQPAHFEDVGANALQFGVKLLEGMFSGHAFLLGPIHYKPECDKCVTRQMPATGGVIVWRSSAHSAVRPD
jgi:hypothetical protein